MRPSPCPDRILMSDDPARASASEPQAHGGADGGSPRFPDLPSVRAALEAGQIGIWSWDIESGGVQWSGNLESIHDLSAGSFDGTFASFQKDIHPEDQPEVLAAIQESLRSGKSYHVQYRLAPRARARGALGRGGRDRGR